MHDPRFWAAVTSVTPLLNEQLSILGALEGIRVEVHADQQDQLFKLRNELLVWNHRFNLTAVDDPAAVDVKHLLDSLSVVPLLERLCGSGPVRLIDVGSGAGFPGLPLAIARPESAFVLVESTRKKVTFIQHAADMLNLRNVTAIHSTAEELARDPGHRGQYDAAIARALGSVPTLVELLVPLVRLGGAALMMKTTPSAGEEVAQSGRALQELGAAAESIVDVRVEGYLPGRAIVVVRKLRDTDDRFPRRPGLPRRRPL